MGVISRAIATGALQGAVRETAGALFGGLTLPGWTVTVAGTVLAAFQAWREGKTALDILVYGLAVFAGLIVVWTFAHAIYQRAKGLPMTSAIRDRLTFGEIADRWAAEVASHPGALSRNEILEELLRGVWLGGFAGNDALVLTKHERRSIESILSDEDAPNYRTLSDENYGSWSRELMASALRHHIVERVPEIPKWDAITSGNTPWAKIATTVRLADLDETSTSAYMEMLSVSKNAFKKWAAQERLQEVGGDCWSFSPNLLVSMKKGKPLTLKEARETKQLGRFIAENPMRGNMGAFDKLTTQMAQGQPPEKPKGRASRKPSAKDRT